MMLAYKLSIYHTSIKHKKFSFFVQLLKTFYYLQREATTDKLNNGFVGGRFLFMDRSSAECCFHHQRREAISGGRSISAFLEDLCRYGRFGSLDLEGDLVAD